MNERFGVIPVRAIDRLHNAFGLFSGGLWNNKIEQMVKPADAREPDLRKTG